METGRLPRASDDARIASSPARGLITGMAAVALLVAVIVVIANVVSTSSARVAATTSTDGLLTAGTVVLTRSDDSAQLLFDADNLYPGREVRGCVELDYLGSTPATIRLHADAGDGSGLDRYIDLRLAVLAGDSCPPVEAAAASSSVAPTGPAVGRELFSGRLARLWRDHPIYASGVTIASDVAPGDRVVIEAIAVVVDDNRAQGLTTDVVFTFEGRPT